VERTYDYSYVSTIFFLATFFTGTHVRLSVRAFTFLFLFRSCYFIWEHTYEWSYVCSIKFFNIRSVVWDLPHPLPACTIICTCIRLFFFLLAVICLTYRMHVWSFVHAFGYFSFCSVICLTVINWPRNPCTNFVYAFINVLNYFF